jgi:CheY-like chemotaxis protein
MSLVARRRPNLIILDLQLPEPDGLIVLQELQANPETSRIPIIVVTNDDPDDAQQVWLENVPVVYKEDLNAGAFDSFIEHVESHLAERNGGS